jgi:UrcA family protein
MSRQAILSSKVTRYPARSALWSALGAATLGLFCSVAGAEERPEQLVVQYADLNLSTQQDANKLYTRLQRASDYVCRKFEGRSPAKARLHQKCYDDALANGVANVDHAVLTALHADKNIRLAQGRGVSQPRS